MEVMPDDCPVGKVVVELRLSVQLELSIVVGKSPLRWIFTFGVMNQGPNPPIDTFRIYPGRQELWLWLSSTWSLWFVILSFLSIFFFLSNVFPPVVSSESGLIRLKVLGPISD